MSRTGTHEASAARPDGLGERPRVELVQRCLIDERVDRLVGEVGEVAPGRADAEVLLFVLSVWNNRAKREHVGRSGLALAGRRDRSRASSLRRQSACQRRETRERGLEAVARRAENALDQSDDALLLEALNREARCFARQVGVGRERLPVATTVDGAAHGTDADRERDVGAEGVVLLAHSDGASVNQVVVERGTDGNFGRELRAVARVDAWERERRSGNAGDPWDSMRAPSRDAPVGPSAVQMPCEMPMSGSGFPRPLQPFGTD